MYTSQVHEFGVSVAPWEKRREWRVITIYRPLAEVAKLALECPTVYKREVDILKDLVDNGWAVAVEQPTRPYYHSWRTLLYRYTDEPHQDADVPDDYKEVTPDQAERLWSDGYDFVVQIRHFWKCPSGADGVDVGYLRRTDGKTKTTPTWRNHAPHMKALFGNCGSEIIRFFVRY